MKVSAFVLGVTGSSVFWLQA